MIGLGTPRICVTTCQISTCNCCIADGILTPTQNSLKSQFLMMISPISSYPSLCCPQHYHHLKTRSLVIALYLSISWSSVITEYSIHQVQHTASTAYTKYSIHQVQHTPSTAYTEYCIHHLLHHPKIHWLLHPTSLWSRCRPHCAQLSTFPQFRVDQSAESQMPWCLPPELPLRDWLPPNTPPLLPDHGLQVHLQTSPITATKCISKLT